MTEDENKPRINLGYPLSQLVKALTGTSEETQKKIKQWQQVLAGMFDGTLEIGSRTPVAETPPWVTLEVVHGGFATGNFAAAGPMSACELQKLKAVKTMVGAPPVKESGPLKKILHRGPINMYYSTESGHAELEEMLKSGCYRIHLPEEGALMVATWLMNNNEAEQAAQIIETIMPFFDELRFYPEPHTQPIVRGSGVFVQTAGDCIKTLRAKRPQNSVLEMNEAITVWNPLYDRAVSLFLETVEGDTPTLQTNVDGSFVRSASGNPVVQGGWPCRNYASDWRVRAQSLLQDYEAARKQHGLCKKQEKPKENFARLRNYLIRVYAVPSSLTGRDVGIIRKILASFVTAHGAPGSDRLTQTRASQRKIAELPLHHILAEVLAERLDSQTQDYGVAELQRYLVPLSAEEASKIHANAAAVFPPSLVKKAKRCLEAEMASLIEQNIITSSELMASVLPLLTARIRSAAIKDNELARVFESVYIAFRKRRSLLLLDLASQVKFEELPWMSVLTPWVGTDDASKKAAKDALTQAAMLAIESFPHTITPNKFVKELRMLAKTADMRVPLVDELAADIFMGAFSLKYLHAAQESSKLLTGSLYERYYGINYEAVLRFDDYKETRTGKLIAPEFLQMCEELVHAELSKGAQWSVARNGAIIEQAQVVTTHNLASLFGSLELSDRMRTKLPFLARDCFAWICHRLQLRYPEWRSELHAIKNCAYAWRQMLFYLSLMDQSELDPFIEWCADHFFEQDPEFQERFNPAVRGLIVAANGDWFDADGRHASGVRRFLGWSTERHWLRIQEGEES